jgi:hypothetical protein
MWSKALQGNANHERRLSRHLGLLIFQNLEESRVPFALLGITSI